MIKTFEEYLEEGLWKSGIERSRTGILRKENGKKVVTDLGVEIVLKNHECTNYNDIIMMILNNHPDLYDVEEMNQLSLSLDKKKKIMDGTSDDYFLVDSPKSRYPYVVYFTPYQTVCDDYYDVTKYCSEEDYNSICKGIAESMKDIKYEFASWGSGGNGETVALLVDEGMVEDRFDEYLTWCESVEDDDKSDIYRNFINEYEESFENEFPRCGSEFVKWSYNGNATNIGLELNYDTIKNYQAYRNFTQEWFGSNVNEALWKSGIERSKSGETRQEDKPVKIKTSLGTNIYIKNVDTDYEMIIRNLLDNMYKFTRRAYYYMCRIFQFGGSYTRSFISPEHSDKIMKGESTYEYLIESQSPDKEPFILIFDDYKKFSRVPNSPDECMEDDYLSICKGVTEAIRNLKCDFVPINKVWTNEGYVIDMIDHEELVDWFTYKMETEGVDTRDDCKFCEDIMYDFNEAFNEKFNPQHNNIIVSWSKHKGISNTTIGVRISYESITHYQEYKEFARNWFGLDSVSEGLWKSGIERSRNGNKRKEDQTIIDKFALLDEDDQNVIFDDIWAIFYNDYNENISNKLAHKFGLDVEYGEHWDLSDAHKIHTNKEVFTILWNFCEENHLLTLCDRMTEDVEEYT